MRLLYKSLIVFLFLIGAVLISNTTERDYSTKIITLDKEIISFLRCFGIEDDSSLNYLKVPAQKDNFKYVTIERSYSVSQDFPTKEFYLKFKGFISKNGFKLKKLAQTPNETYPKFEIVFKKSKIYTLNLQIKKKPYLAIVIDDWGYSKAILPYLKSINIPLNISILPGLKYSQATSRIAYAYGHEILLHLPMEPLPSEKIEKQLESTSIKKSMNEGQINLILNDFLNNLENIKGVNNHMGSLITTNKKIMSIILKALKEKEIYYLDSKVVSDSIAPEIAKEINIVFFERDIFLDNEAKKEYIKNQILKAIEISKENGFAIAIGHARKTTLKTIESMIPDIIENTYPVKISTLK